MNTAHGILGIATQAALALAIGIGVAFLCCTDCGGKGGGVAIVGMADEEAYDCETCKGDGEAVCELCGEEPAVAVLLSPFRELACAGCGAVAKEVA